MSSLGCCRQSDLIETLEELAVKAAIPVEVERCTGWERESVVENCKRAKKRMTQIAEKDAEILTLQRPMDGVEIARHTEIEEARVKP